MAQSGGLTIRQEAFAQAIARGAKSQSEAAREAGYSDSDIARAGHEASRNLKVRARVDEIKTGGRDHARRISRLSAVKVESALGDPQTDPMFALAAWKTSAEVQERLPDDAPPPPIDVDGIVARFLDIFEAGVRAATQHGLTLERWQQRRRGVAPVDAPGARASDVTTPIPKISPPLDVSAADSPSQPRPEPEPTEPG